MHCDILIERSVIINCTEQSNIHTLWFNEVGSNVTSFLIVPKYLDMQCVVSATRDSKIFAPGPRLRRTRCLYQCNRQSRSYTSARNPRHKHRHRHNSGWGRTRCAIACCRQKSTDLLAPSRLPKRPATTISRRDWPCRKVRRRPCTHTMPGQL